MLDKSAGKAGKAQASSSFHGGGVSNSAEFLSRNLGWHDETLLSWLAQVICVKVAGVSWYLYSSGT